MKVYLDCCAYNRPFDDQRNIITHKPFDYTEWQQNMYKDVPLEKFYNNVKKYREGQIKPEKQ